MHFSSPSGQRLSWCRPWKRGAVGSFSKGYCSVTTFLNIVRKVTPKPATGSTNCSLKLLGPGELPAELPLVRSAIDLLLRGHALGLLDRDRPGHRLAGGRRQAEDQ